MVFFLLATLLLYLASAFYAVIRLITKADAQAGESSAGGRLGQAGRTLRALVLGGFALHTATLGAQWAASGQFPAVNAKGLCSFIAWAIAAYYLHLSRRYRARALPVFILPCAALLVLVSLALPPGEGVPTRLQSSIAASTATQILFPVHITLLVFSSAAFVITVVAGAMFLLQEHALKTKQFGAAFHWLPALNTCDELCYRALTVGFVLLTLGMATGMAWSALSHGRIWQNSPKEVMALVTWAIYLLMMHYRLTVGWSGRRGAWLAIGGFVAVLATWVGTHAVGGYHVFG
jgi:ABC-type transport system involved in cytochrome c biogenesis permease subunit